MRVRDPERRLRGLWGRIDRQHNDAICAWLPAGGYVLDAGCGYGALTGQLVHAGFRAVGIDPDSAAVSIARSLHPGVDFRVMRAGDADPGFDGAFDAVVLKDVLHHLMGEGDGVAALRDLRRCLRPGGSLIVLDPNPSLVLRTARAIVRHRDFEIAPTGAIDVLATTGFMVKDIAWFETIGLAMSGGYVGPVLVPPSRWVHEAVARWNDRLSRLAVRAGLGPALCWRYLIRAERPV